MNISKRNKGLPLASVVMSACATEQSFFKESIESILAQSISNFELIVVDDGLSAENKEYLSRIEDLRLRVVVNKRNMGQSWSVNTAIEKAKGEFIIRMDADDVMLPTRIEDEVAFMREQGDVLVAGACARRTDNDHIVPRRYPSTESLEMGLLFACDMVHPTMVIRREAALKVGLRYDETQKYAQDYMFWADALERGSIALIPKVVLNYRVHPGQISKKKSAEQLACASRARAKMFSRLGISLSDEELVMLSDFVVGKGGRRLSDYNFFLTSLLVRAKGELDSPRFELFKRELFFRILKAGLRSMGKDRSFAALRWKYFWKSIRMMDNWPFYIKSMR